MGQTNSNEAMGDQLNQVDRSFETNGELELPPPLQPLHIRRQQSERPPRSQSHTSTNSYEFVRSHSASEATSHPSRNYAVDFSPSTSPAIFIGHSPASKSKCSSYVTTPFLQSPLMSRATSYELTRPSFTHHSNGEFEPIPFAANDWLREGEVIVEDSWDESSEKYRAPTAEELIQIQQLDDAIDEARWHAYEMNYEDDRFDFDRSEEYECDHIQTSRVKTGSSKQRIHQRDSSSKSSRKEMKQMQLIQKARMQFEKLQQLQQQTVAAAAAPPGPSASASSTSVLTRSVNHRLNKQHPSMKPTTASIPNPVLPANVFKNRKLDANHIIHMSDVCAWINQRADEVIVGRLKLHSNSFTSTIPDLARIQFDWSYRTWSCYYRSSGCRRMSEIRAPTRLPMKFNFAASDFTMLEEALLRLFRTQIESAFNNLGHGTRIRSLKLFQFDPIQPESNYRHHRSTGPHRLMALLLKQLNDRTKGNSLYTELALRFFPQPSCRYAPLLHDQSPDTTTELNRRRVFGPEGIQFRPVNLDHDVRFFVHSAEECQQTCQVPQVGYSSANLSQLISRHSDPNHRPIITTTPQLVMRERMALTKLPESIWQWNRLRPDQARILRPTLSVLPHHRVTAAVVLNVDGYASRAAYRQFVPRCRGPKNPQVHEFLMAIPFVTIEYELIPPPIHRPDLNTKSIQAELQSAIHSTTNQLQQLRTSLSRCRAIADRWHQTEGSSQEPYSRFNTGLAGPNDTWFTQTESDQERFWDTNPNSCLAGVIPKCYCRSCHPWCHPTRD